LNRFMSDGDAFIVLDALDEARMRVSGLSWIEFVGSLSSAATTGHHFVLLGRERVLEDVWLTLSDAEVSVCWIEISHFDAAQRTTYVDTRVRHKRSIDSGAYRAARDAVLSALAGTVDIEHADSFVGYAPVLD